MNIICSCGNKLNIESNTDRDCLGFYNLPIVSGGTLISADYSCNTFYIACDACSKIVYSIQ